VIEQYKAVDAAPPLLSSIDIPPCTCCQASEEDNAAVTALLPMLLFFHHHRVMKEQRHALYRQHQPCLSSSDGSDVVITLDYKQNIKLNIGPVEESRRFYNEAQRTVLGFLCQYKEQATGQLVNHYVDYLSPCLTHNAAFALQCMSDLVTHFLLPRGLHHLQVWSDCGPHFRCNEMLAGVTIELPSALRRSSIPLTSSYHYFAEKHGKSAVDGHFSLLSRWLREASAQRDIVSQHDLEQALQQQANSHITHSSRSPNLPLVRCNFRSYTPFCQEHDGAYHTSLCPPSSHCSPSADSKSSDEQSTEGERVAEVVQPSLSSDGDELEASLPMCDDDGAG
jgi:hypothetical protein